MKDTKYRKSSTSTAKTQASSLNQENKQIIISRYTTLQVHFKVLPKQKGKQINYLFHLRFTN